MLPDEMFDKLSTNPDIIKQLSDPLLQKILNRLDSSRDRRYTFSKLCETSPIFLELVNSISDAIDYKAKYD